MTKDSLIEELVKALKKLTELAVWTRECGDGPGQMDQAINEAKTALSHAHAVQSDGWQQKRIGVLEGALREIQRLGEEGCPPDYKKWLGFHDIIADIARNALAANDQPSTPRISENLAPHAGLIPTIFASNAQSDGWQPIATAPKDGTQILVAYARQPWVEIASYDEDLCAWMITNDDAADEPPTYWRPLPSPPSKQEG